MSFRRSREPQHVARKPSFCEGAESSSCGNATRPARSCTTRFRNPRPRLKLPTFLRNWVRFAHLMCAPDMAHSGTFWHIVMNPGDLQMVGNLLAHDAPPP